MVTDLINNKNYQNHLQLCKRKIMDHSKCVADGHENGHGLEA